jgi:putative ABC transport system permease protein
MLVLKNLLRRRIRTTLSILGITIGIGAIVAFHAMGRGFKDTLDRMFRETGADMLVINRLRKDPAFSRVKKEEQEFIAGLPQVEHQSGGTFILEADRGLKALVKMDMLLVWGRPPGDRLIEKFRKRMRGDIIKNDREVMVGYLAARSLGVKPDDTLELFGRPFKVVGVYESNVQLENAGAIVANSVVQQELNIGETVAMTFVYLKPGADADAFRKAVEAKYPHLQAIRTEEFTSYYDQLQYIEWFVWIITLVSVVVGGLGVLNTMLMSVSERTREIGTLRAVGWSRARVLRLILAEGMLMSVAGGLVGLGVGAVGAEILIRSAPKGLEALYTLSLFAQAFAVAIVLGFVGAFYPAWQASRLAPIEALKYE